MAELYRMPGAVYRGEARERAPQYYWVTFSSAGDIAKAYDKVREAQKDSRSIFCKWGFNGATAIENEEQNGLGLQFSAAEEDLSQALEQFFMDQKMPGNQVSTHPPQRQNKAA